MKVLIAGGVPTGSQLAMLLLEQNHQVTILEDQPAFLQDLHLELPTEVIYEDNCMNLDALEHAGIRTVDVLVACTPSDADNLVLCYLATQIYQVPRTIGRINNPRHAWLFNDKLHVDVALDESSILAHLIEEEMSLGDMMTLLKLRRGKYSLTEAVIPPGARAVGTAIKDLQLPEECVIASIIREGQMIVPRGITVLQAGDDVLAIADARGQEQLAELFTLDEP